MKITQDSEINLLSSGANFRIKVSAWLLAAAAYNKEKEESQEFESTQKKDTQSMTNEETYLSSPARPAGAGARLSASCAQRAACGRAWTGCRHYTARIQKMLMLQSFRPSNKLLYLKLGDWILKVNMRKQAELKCKSGEEIQTG